MAKSHMFPAVVQAIVLTACATIVSHHLLTRAYDQAANSHLVANLTNIMQANASIALGRNTTGASFDLNTTALDSSGLMNATATAGGTTEGESFYWRNFPKEMVVIIVLAPLMYYWHIWLERTFPGRRRGPLVPVPEKFFDEGPESHEEAVVQKWIARGQIRRASLSGWNTFFKWLLNLTLGNLWIQVLTVGIEDVVLARSLQLFRDGVWWFTLGIFLRCVFSLTDLSPLTSLIAFVVVPAHQRIVFMAGIDLLWSTLVGTVLGLLVPWLEGLESIQRIFQEATNEMIRQQTLANSTRSIGEL